MFLRKCNNGDKDGISGSTRAVEEFDQENERFSAYYGSVLLFFGASGIDAEKHVPVFLSLLGAKVYSLVRDLVVPTLPQETSLEELGRVLKTHFEPTPSIIAQRFHFYRRNQRNEKAICVYVAELKRLANHWSLNEFLNDALRDRLVCGLQEESIQRRLLTDNLTFVQAVQIAQGMEAARQSVKDLQKSTGVCVPTTVCQMT